MPRLKKEVALCLALALSAIAPFGRVGTLGFTNFDDPGYVTQNAMVRQGLTPAGVTWAFTSTEQSNWHPVTWLSHMLDVQLYGMNPAGHHVTSLMFHAASTLLLFGALFRMTGAAGRSAVVAALFAVHPLHVESVAWIAERKDVLSAFFWMLTMLAYVRYVRKPRAANYLLVMISFTLGLASKPMLVTLPFVLLLLDVWPLGRLAEKARAPGAPPRGSGGIPRRIPAAGIRRLILEKSPLLLLSAASAVVTYLAQQGGGSVVSFRHLGLGARLANAILAYGWYLKKAVLPYDLAVFYPRAERVEPAAVLLGFVLLGTFTWACVRYRSGRLYLPVGWFWYLGTLVPVIGLIQVGDQAMADRYSYLPLIGIFAAVVWAAADGLEARNVDRRVLALLPAVLILLLGAAAWRQVGHWKGSRTLFSHAIQVTGDNPLAYLNFGAALASEGKLDEAAALYRGALSANPDTADIHANLGMILTMQGRNDEARGHYLAALRIEPDQPEAHNGLALVLAAEGSLEEAEGHCRAALRARPAYPEARYNLGKVLAARGRPDLAIDQLNQALRLKPDFHEARERLADVLQGQGRLDEAIGQYAEIVRVKPESADAHYRLGLGLYRRRRSDEALPRFREAARLRPDWPDALNTLAWLLATGANATQKDAAESVVLAQKAVSLARKPDAAMLDTLAAAYAAAGRFEEALTTADDAIRLAGAAGDQALSADLDRRRRLYSSRQSYREAPQ